MGPLIDALTAQSAERVKMGIQPPKWVYSYVISDVENLLKPDNALIEDLTAKVAKPDIEAAEKARMDAAPTAAWAASAGPAYTRLHAEMKRHQPDAQTAHGVWRLPAANAVYDARLHQYTTPAPTP